MSNVLPNLYISSFIELPYTGLSAGDLNINAAVNLRPDVALNVTQLNLNWNDDLEQVINKDGILFDVIKLMDSFLAKDKKVVVNCVAGVSRSASIVIAYLIYKKNMSYEQAYNFLKMKRPIINPNPSFVQQLSYLEKQLQTLNPQNKVSPLVALTSVRSVSTYFD